MAQKVVVMLQTEEGRALVRKKCRAAGTRISTLEELIEAELDQQGKMRKAGQWEEFDSIFDSVAPQDSE